MKTLSKILIFTILIISVMVNVCIAQTNMEINKKYYIRSIINPDLLNLVLIKDDNKRKKIKKDSPGKLWFEGVYDDNKLKKIKKDSPEYQILRESNTIFTCLDRMRDEKNNIEYDVLKVFNKEKQFVYYFPKVTKKGVLIDFLFVKCSQYYEQFNKLQNCNYVDLIKFNESMDMNLKCETGLLYDRFYPIKSGFSLEFDEKQNFKVSFSINDKDFTYDLMDFVKKSTHILVPKEKINEFNKLNKKLEQYKKDYLYWDLKKYNDIPIHYPGNRICSRFYPMEIDRVSSNENWSPEISFWIDNKSYNISENGFLNYAANNKTVEKCIKYYEYIETFQTNHHYIDIAFCDKDKNDFTVNPDLLYEKYLPIKYIYPYLDKDYKELAEIEVNSKKYIITKADLEKYVKTTQELEQIRIEYQKCLETIAYYNEHLKNYLFYHEMDVDSYLKYLANDIGVALIGFALTVQYRNAIKVVIGYAFTQDRKAIFVTHSDVDRSQFNAYNQSDIQKYLEALTWANDINSGKPIEYTYTVSDGIITLTDSDGKETTINYNPKDNTISDGKYIFKRIIIKK